MNMNIAKAIEINALNVKDRIPVGELDELRAVNLGIEALIFFRQYQELIAKYQDARLLVETPDIHPSKSFTPQLHNQPGHFTGDGARLKYHWCSHGGE